ncbi:uncharacterized protein LOC110025267 isoform X3 [Phalaenopsis equestris]|uniref:uncharacterized protein LOC110025267 isoform X3 n=1 Tax=Phalaenopsis equestris TaxID=78828 RepID=UPI0009E4AB18|nr:uncharacterized protein LOC110025267 isoform X3 [Phalaenopsis equestris]
MAIRKLPRAAKRRGAARKADIHRQSAEELARIFIRRRTGALAPRKPSFSSTSMVEGKLLGAAKRRGATRKADIHRKSAEELARIFIRRRTGASALPALKKKISADSSSSDVEAVSDEQSIIETYNPPYLTGFQSDSVDQPMCMVYNADVCSQNLSEMLKTTYTTYSDYLRSLAQEEITSIPVRDYLKFPMQDKTTVTPLNDYLMSLVQEKITSITLSDYLKPFVQDKFKGMPLSGFLTSLVQDKEPLFNLEQEATSHLLQDKLKELREKYASFRRVLGDGNCFFRAFKFAYLEHILLMKDMEEAVRIFAKMTELKDRILQDNMTPSESLMSDYDAFCNIVQLVSPISENSISHSVLLEWSKNENGYSDPAIRFLRMVTSNEIRSRPNHFEESILGLSSDTTMTVQKFCEVEVEPMGKDVDNVQITAFVDALGVPIRIEYVYDSKHRLNHFDFGVEASPLAEPYITLLFRPGHYDILYTKEYHMLVPEPVQVVLNDSKTPEKEPFLKEPVEDVSVVSETSEEEPKTIVKDPATSEMDPIDKGKVMRMTTLRTYIRRKQKETDE